MPQPDPQDQPAAIVHHFVVLGAGASYGARDDSPCAPRPPLGVGLAEYLLRWLAANDPKDWGLSEEIRATDCGDPELPYPCEAIADPNTRRRILKFLQCATWPTKKGAQVGFEKGMEKLWERCYRRPQQPLRTLANANSRDRQPIPGLAACRLIVRLNQLIAWSLTTGNKCAFRERADLYDDLVSLLGEPNGLAVISLNYDVLFEEALERQFGRDCLWYPGLRFGGTAKMLPVYKLHGSCNWFVMPGSANCARQCCSINGRSRRNI